jgi:hypothetical protein
MPFGLVPAEQRSQPFRAFIWTGVMLAAAGRVCALPADFRVLNDDLTAPGGFGAEIQASHARSRSGTDDEGGPVHQALLELSAGLAPQWELSLQMPATRLADGAGWRGTGANLELTYIAPHDDDDGGYWGWRAEFGRARPPGERAAWAWEWRPILGYRWDDWHGVLNPGLSANVSVGDRRLKFEPAGKLSYQLSKPLALGVEYFVEGGPLSRLSARRDRSEIGLLVVDGQWGACNLTVGVGKGFAGATEGRVMKLLLSYAWEGAGPR